MMNTRVRLNAAQHNGLCVRLRGIQLRHEVRYDHAEAGLLVRFDVKLGKLYFRYGMPQTLI